MDLHALADFNLVATHRGFGRASRASGKPKATLSRRVMELEESLGVRLFERGARELKLTEAGSNLAARTGNLLHEIAEVGDAIRAGQDRPRGPLRVSAPVLLAHIALGRIAAIFARAHPEVRLEIIAEDRFVDPVEEGYDVVIRINPAPDDRLVGRCFLHGSLVMVAHPSLRLPQVDGDVVQPVPAILHTATPPNTLWRVASGDTVNSYRPEPLLRLSTLVMVRDALLAYPAAGVLPRFLVASDLAAGHLTLCGQIESRPVAIWALHPSRRLVSNKVSAFIRALVEAFPDRLL